MSNGLVLAQRRDEKILAIAAVQGPCFRVFGCEQYCMQYIPPDGTFFALAESSMLSRGSLGGGLRVCTFDINVI